MNSPSSKEYYDQNLQKHGTSAQGVGWKNREAQEVRFEQLAKLIYSDGPFSVNDLGCGTGDLFPFLNDRFENVSYRGYDLMPEMIARAKAQINYPDVSFNVIKNSDEMIVADYTVASGILNLKFDMSDENWKNYIISTLHEMDKKSLKGFAFNALTSYSDKDLMKQELYYSDPLWLFDYCKKNFAKNVALLHDYSMYDFTIHVKKNF